jgi:type IV pilus assembly protein PilP
MKKKAIRTHVLVFLLIFGSLCFTGCEKKKEIQPQKQTKSKQPVKPTVPVQKQVSTAISPSVTGTLIDFANQKDPFRPIVVASKKAPAAKKNRFGQVIPILNYEVPQFKISGIIIGMKESTAMVVDPSGKPYVVKVGTEIGRNNGRITKIAPNYIEVFEQYRDENGKLIKKTIRLTLPKKE